MVPHGELWGSVVSGGRKGLAAGDGDLGGFKEAGLAVSGRGTC